MPTHVRAGVAAAGRRCLVIRARVVAAPVGFRSSSLSGWGLFFFAVSASAPMTVLVGGIIGAFAVSGMVAVPAAFLLLAVVLALVWVGHVGMAQSIRHSGPLYAHVAQGLGAVPGVSAAAVALLSYNAIQCCLYGLFGQTMADLGLGPWWLWALAAWALVAVAGLAPLTVTAKTLAFLLGVELLVVLGFALFGLGDAPGGAAPGVLWPGHLLGDGVGSVLALVVACFVGTETTLAFAEEAVSHRVLARASFGSLAFLGVLYTLAAWAVIAVAGGVAQVNSVTATQGQQLVFGLLQHHLGVLGLVLAQLFLATSIVAAMLSFHQTIARYTFTLSRERLLPARLGRLAVSTGAPVGGSLAQSAIGLTVIGVCVVFGIDPANLFYYLAAVAAVGVMSLLAVNGWAGYAYFSRRRWSRSMNTRLRALPALGGLGMSAVVLLTIGNLHAMTGAPPGSWQVWVLPAIVGAVAVAGLLWGAVISFARPQFLATIGHGETEPLAVLAHHLVPQGSRL